MADKPPAIEPETHRRIAIDLFNAVWTMMEKPSRTPEEDDAMIHAAHASRHHWGQVGTPTHFARGDWQVSRVYAVLRRAEPCRHHAQRCLDFVQANGIGDFDLAFAYEALARAAMIAGNSADCRAFLDKAHAAAANITDAEDKKIVMDDLVTIVV